MNDKVRSALWAGGFLLALAAAVYLLMPEGGQIVYDVRRTSFRTSLDGVAALYRGIERLGQPVAPRMTPLVDADPLRGTLVVLEPADAPSPREVGALLAWVRTGGTLLYAPRFDAPLLDPTARRPGTPPPILDSLGLALRKLVPLPSASARKDGGPPDRPAGEARGTGEAHGTGEARWASHPLTEGLPEPVASARIVLSGDAASRFDAATRQRNLGGSAARGRTPVHPSVPMTTLLHMSVTSAGNSPVGAAAAALIPLGDGRILAFADAGPLSNDRAATDPQAALAVRAAIAYTAPGDTVFFDEFHHGVHGLGSPAEAAASFFFGSARGHALFHLGVVAFLAVAVAGVRFGAPADPPLDERRSPLEHVSALGALYHRAEARETAALLLLSRLARWAHAPPPRNLDEAGALLDRLESDKPADTALHIRRIRSALHASPAELVAIAAGIDGLTRRTRPSNSPQRSHA